MYINSKMANNIPPGYHVEVVGDARFVVPLRYSNLKPIGSGAQGFVV
ncbi:unnamed protein product [Schistosoma mattheei]|nr:unnamed protein product [Schistosoma mattheei]